MLDIIKKDQLIIKLSERLDATNSEKVAELIAKDLESLDRELIIDVNDLTYISSAGLQVVLRCAKAAKAIHKDVFLKGAKDNVLEIFRLSGFLTFLQLK